MKRRQRQQRAIDLIERIEELMRNGQFAEMPADQRLTLLRDLETSRAELEPALRPRAQGVIDAVGEVRP